MISVSDDTFRELIGNALQELPQEYVKRMEQTVAIVWEDEPTEIQRQQLNLHKHETLFGLYEGLPLPQRYSGYTKLTPDKITIFKGPIERYCNDVMQLKEQIKHTVWHEMAHYFGLDHARIHELEQ